jgi:hypothetical protein
MTDELRDVTRIGPPIEPLPKIEPPKIVSDVCPSCMGSGYQSGSQSDYLPYANDGPCWMCGGRGKV